MHKDSRIGCRDSQVGAGTRTRTYRVRMGEI